MISLLKKIRRYLIWRQYLLRGNFNKDKWYFVLSYGIGDAYIVSAIISEFTKKQGDVVLVFTKPNQEFIGRLFDKKIETRILKNYNKGLSNEFGKFKKGQPINLHPNDLYGGKFETILGFKDINLVDVYKILLGININAPLSKPVFARIKSNIVKDYFVKSNLTIGKTVLLCPNANSISTLDPIFWLILADKLAKNGFTPTFMNSRDKNQLYPTIEFPLQHSMDVCNEANYVVSLRSGFTDLIATSTAKKIILYPDTMGHSGKLIDACSLIKMGLASPTNTFELVLDKDNEYIYRKILTIFYD
ncbi:hypothetical protein [Pedobacter xixiisoli]|uniref:ADP-heptose:LPS heptosyltransferase n=1 Tax=Pedobacter xixiisoli TaxID=1476464 RepID=A0A286A9Q0_9SPHI|nr:hypothetical protein [Pedobacter xixiisoli]SOD18636.1 hypothetical protein SAMN06297358_3108 [Pedobacter xixiisoli]